VAQHPSSALAKLVHRGVEYSNAQTPFPSDSFPGMVAQVTGGNPSSTGVFYDDSWNHALFPAGTTSCVGPAPGAEVTYFEQADQDLTRLDAGQGLPNLPGDILQMTGNPTTLIDPAQLPVDPATCTPVYPHEYIKVNTIFVVETVDREQKHVLRNRRVLRCCRHTRGGDENDCCGRETANHEKPLHVVPLSLSLGARPRASSGAARATGVNRW
jgi:Type I phosphodiesterase / nucleotide pyrophosphatase